MYRTIDASFWTDPDIRALSGTDRYLFLYFVSNPHAHVSGIYYLPRVMIEHETGLKGKALGKGIETLSKRFFVWYDLPNEVVFVRSMFRYQGRGKNHDQSAAKQLNNLHKSSLVGKFLSIYPEISELLDKNKGVRNPLQGGSKGVRRGFEGGSEFPTPEQEQEREQEKEKGSLTGPQKEKSALDSASSSPHGDGCSKPNGFDEFWREYPRKVGKQAARKAWKKRRPGTQLTGTIVEAIQAQVGKGHFQGNDGQQYIPNPATWLNQERWEDEIAPSVEEKRKRKWEEISKKVSLESEP